MAPHTVASMDAETQALRRRNRALNSEVLRLMADLDEARREVRSLRGQLAEANGRLRVYRRPEVPSPAPAPAVVKVAQPVPVREGLPRGLLRLEVD